MKKIAKLFILVLMTAIIASALFIVSSAETASEPVTYSNTNARGTYTAASDIKVTAASGNEGIYVKNGNSFTLDLDGHTMTLEKRFRVNLNSGSVVTVKNGTIKCSGSLGYFIPQAGNTIIFDNCTFDIDANASHVMHDGGSNILFKNCTIKVNGYRGSNGVFCMRLDADSAGRNYVFQNTLINVEDVNTNLFRYGYGDAETKKEYGLNIYFIDGTRIVNQHNTDNFVAKKSVATTYVVNFGFEEGTLLNGNVLNTTLDDYGAVNFYKTASYENGALALGTTFTAPEAFGLSGDATYQYQVSENVYNVGFSADGQLLDTKAYAEGVTPTAPQLPDDVALTKDGEVYYEERANGWTDVEGGEAVEIVSASADVTYYMTVVKKPATFVEFNDLGEILTYSVSNVITLAQFKAFKAGSTIELFDNLTYEEAEDIGGYKNNLTFDLNGNTLYLQSNPIKLIGNSLTVEDGYVVSIASNNIFHGDPNKTALANNKLTLTDVDFTTQLNFIHCPAGEFCVDNCTVTLADGKSGGAVFHHDIRYGAQDVTTTILVEANKLDVYGFGTNFVNLYLRSTRVSTYDMSFSFTDCNLQNQGRMFNMALDTGYSAEKAVNDSLNISFVRCNLLARTHDEGATANDKVFIYAPAASGITDATCYFEDCRLSARPSFGCGEIIYADGQVMANSDDAIYPIRVLDPNYSMKANLTLSSDFTVNFYVPENTTIKTITIGGTTYTIEDLTADTPKDGVNYYAFSQNGIRADKAVDKITYTVAYYDEELGENLIATKEYSVLDYANAILAGASFSTDSKRLICAAMEYVLAAYEYTLEEGQTVPAELTKFFTNENYIAPTEVTVPTSTTNEGNIADAIVDARLNLSSELKLRFKLVADYSGTLIINNQSYAVVDGKYQDADYIELNLRAYDLGDQIITITSANGAINGTYDLAAYINSVTGTSDKLDDLLKTLYTYCYEANLYKNAHPELD